MDISTSFSQILITENLENTISKLLVILPLHNTRVIKNENSPEFLLAQANMVIKEAYIATEEKKYIVLCGESFRKEAQNSLLKILEEPPKNIIFFILTSSKSSLLSTIHSRLPLKSLKEIHKTQRVDLDLKRLGLKELYLFLKENQRIAKIEAKTFVESLLYTIYEDEIRLNHEELEAFSKAIKLIELNSKPINILTMLLLKVIHRESK